MKTLALMAGMLLSTCAWAADPCSGKAGDALTQCRAAGASGG
jgi:hypothetical protein